MTLPAPSATLKDMKNAEDSLPEWEERCCRCGRCCYEKIDFDGKIYYTNVPCERLDLQTRLCTVYTHRDRERRGCMRLTPEIVRRGFLPADCPYVAGIADYVAPRLWEEDES